MTAILKGSNYDPSQGGHAPGDLRRAFDDAINVFQKARGINDTLTVKLREQDVPIAELCGLLWDCTDTMRGLTWTQLMEVAELHGKTRLDAFWNEDPLPGPGSSGAAARWLRDQMPSSPPALQVV